MRYAAAQALIGVRATMVLIGLLIPIATLGCQPERLMLGIELHNDGSSPARISYVVNGSERSAADDINGDMIAPGEYKRFYFDASDRTPSCTQGDIVARADDGREVARIPPPVCFNDRRSLSEYPARGN